MPGASPRVTVSQIDETAKDIDEQLAQINADRAELLAYQALDKRQRGIEYALLDRELTSARKELSKVRQAAQWVWARAPHAAWCAWHAALVQEQDEHIFGIQRRLSGGRLCGGWFQCAWQLYLSARQAHHLPTHAAFVMPCLDTALTSCYIYTRWPAQLCKVSLSCSMS